MSRTSPTSLMIRLLRSCLLLLVLTAVPLAGARAQSTQGTETQEHLNGQVQHLSDKIAATEKKVDVQRPTQAQLG